MSYQSAVVIGSSMAGLVSARVLADYFDHVTVIERDPEPTPDAPRRGVPQGNHAHLLLKSGEMILEKFFPGIVDEMIEDGSVVVNFGNDVRWWQHGVWKIRHESKLSVISQTRPFLEWHVRSRLQALSNVEICYETTVQELITSDDKSEILGVKIRVGDSEAYDLDANLVIDATGRGSRMPQWLDEMGYGKPKTSVIPIGLTYASCHFTPPSNHNFDWKVLVVSHAAPIQKRAGFLLPAENNTWTVTLNGYLGEKIPTSLDGFLDYAQSLDQPDFYEAIKHATPISEVKSYGIPQQIRQHYEKMKRLPKGLLVTGDAYCAFDPVYGQGMSVAAQEANALHEVLAGQKAKGTMQGLEQAYFRKIAKLVDVPWLLTYTEAMRFNQIEGSRSPLTKFMHWYTRILFKLCGSETNVYGSVIEVLNLVTSPFALFKPSLFKRVITAKVD